MDHGAPAAVAELRPHAGLAFAAPRRRGTSVPSVAVRPAAPTGSGVSRVKRRERAQTADEPPAHLREFAPERSIAETALQSLRDHPGDVWCASDVRLACLAARVPGLAGRTRHRAGLERLRAAARSRPAPMAWVCAEFALRVNDDPTICPKTCVTHADMVTPLR